MNADKLRENLRIKDLTNREIEVSELVVMGLSNKEIGNQLFITERTVKAHLVNIYSKLELRSRAQLIVFCLPLLGFKNE